jgi:hypothetical protein
MRCGGKREREHGAKLVRMSAVRHGIARGRRGEHGGRYVLFYVLLQTNESLPRVPHLDPLGRRLHIVVHQANQVALEHRNRDPSWPRTVQ